MGPRTQMGARSGWTIHPPGKPALPPTGPGTTEKPGELADRCSWGRGPIGSRRPTDQSRGDVGIPPGSSPRPSNRQGVSADGPPHGPPDPAVALPDRTEGDTHGDPSGVTTVSLFLTIPCPARDPVGPPLRPCGRWT
jgi:hypothetical protein